MEESQKVRGMMREDSGSFKK